jgi:hypothetical protein
VGAQAARCGGGAGRPDERCSAAHCAPLIPGPALHSHLFPIMATTLREVELKSLQLSIGPVGGGSQHATVELVMRGGWGHSTPCDSSRQSLSGASSQCQRGVPLSQPALAVLLECCVCSVQLSSGTTAWVLQLALQLRAIPPPPSSSHSSSALTSPAATASCCVGTWQPLMPLTLLAAFTCIGLTGELQSVAHSSDTHACFGSIRLSGTSMRACSPIPACMDHGMFLGLLLGLS